GQRQTDVDGAHLPQLGVADVRCGFRGPDGTAGRPSSHEVIYMQKNRRSRESGSSILELAIVLPMIGLTFFGTMGLGIMIGRYVQVVQVARDIAHIYSSGVDFTTAGPRNMLTQKLALGAGMTDTGGNGVV